MKPSTSHQEMLPLSKSSKRTFEIEPQESPSENKTLTEDVYFFYAMRSAAGSGLRISLTKNGESLFEIDVPASMVKKYPYAPVALTFNGLSQEGME